MGVIKIWRQVIPDKKCRNFTRSIFYFDRLKGKKLTLGKFLVTISSYALFNPTSMAYLTTRNYKKTLLYDILA